MPVTGHKGFPYSSVGRESACNAGDLGSIPGSGRSPGEGNGKPPRYSCLENPMNRGAWQSRTLLSDFSLHFWPMSVSGQAPNPSLIRPRRGRTTNLPNPPLKSRNLNHRRSVLNGQALGKFPGQGAGLPEVAGRRLLFVVWAADGKEKPELRRRCGAAVTTGARAASSLWTGCKPGVPAVERRGPTPAPLLISPCRGALSRFPFGTLTR